MLTINENDITKAVISAEVTEKINSGAAVLKFSVLAGEAAKLKNGDRVLFAENGYTLFAGKVFSRSVYRNIAEISAFDSIADLKTVMPVKRNSGKASDFVKEIFLMASQFVNSGQVDSCDEELVPDSYKNVSLLNILYRVIDEIKAKERCFVLRDESGAVTFRNEELLRCDYTLSGKNVISFNYQHSAEDCYNFVKLISNNVDKGFDDIAIARNEDSIAKFGVRGITKKVYEKNPEQLTALAKKLLEENGIEKERLTVTAVGNAEVRAGCRMWCNIDGLGEFWARIISSKHYWEGKSHFMQLEMEPI